MSAANPQSPSPESPPASLPRAAGEERGFSQGLQKLRIALFSPQEIAWLVFFRIAFGGIMLWEVWRYFDMDRIRRYYIEPVFHFTYYGFSWVRPWEGDGMYLHFYALGILSVCILLGLFYRVAATLFFLGFTYVFLLDQTQHLNHFYLVCLISFLLIFVPAHRAFSLDAWRKPGLHASRVPAWSLGLLRAQIGLVYFYGGIAKLGPDWLAGEPMRAWLAQRLNFPLIGRFFQEEPVVYAFVFGGLFLDLFITPLLLWKRTRLAAFGAAVAFHLLNAQLFTIGIFPWFMLCATLLFFPPEAPRRMWEKIRGKTVSPPPPESVGPLSGPWTRSQKTVAILMACYLAFQVLMPLRHWLYPGNVDWTEEGHRFSWHMKLRSKSARTLFLITDKASGRVMAADPTQILNSRQYAKMSSRPDMILQFAHYLRDHIRESRGMEVEVRVEAEASLNGRQVQRLIDPSVDLAQEPRNLAHARWIVPLTEPLGPRPGEKANMERGMADE